MSAKKLISLEQCRDYCSNATDFVCRSFEYNTSISRCFLSNITFIQGVMQTLVRAASDYILMSCEQGQFTKSIDPSLSEFNTTLYAIYTILFKCSYTFLLSTSYSFHNKYKYSHSTSVFTYCISFVS